MTDRAWEMVKDIIGIIAIATVTIVFITSSCECEKKRLESINRDKHEVIK